MARRNEVKERETKDYTNKENANEKCSQNDKYSGRGRKSRGKGRNRKDSGKEQKVKQQGVNDISWYQKNPSLVSIACSIPFGFPNGVNLATVDDVDNQNRNAINSLGGICVQDIIPTPGWSDYTGSNGAQVIDIAARDIYAWVRHANSGASNYEPADLLTYLLAMDEMYMWHTNIRRLYGCAYLFNAQNRFVGKELITALGFDADDILQHLPELNYHLNSLAARINSFYVPASFPIYQRHAFLYSGIFMDSTDLKSQMYAMKPVGFRTFETQFNNEANPPWGFLAWRWLKEYTKLAGATTPAHVGTYSLKYADIVAISEELVNNMRVNEDIGIMSGDIKKAYGDALFVVDITPLEYTAPVSTDIAMLNQFGNATPLGEFNWKTRKYNPASGGTGVDVHSLSISQDPSQEGSGRIIFAPVATKTGASSTDAVFGGRLLNLKEMSGTPEDVMYTTRLMTIPYMGYDGVDDQIYFKCIGSEICGSLHVYYGTVDSFQHTELDYESALIITNTGDLKNSTVIAGATVLCNFRFAPRIVPYFSFTREGIAKRVYLSIMDVDNYARIESKMLQNMHDTALFSLWNVPNRG